MNNIKISKVCGLCAGCRHAVSVATKLAESGENVCLFKELVHNQNMLEKLQKLGIKTKNSLDELKKSDFVVLRAHGEPPKTYEYLKEHGINYVDCTCVKVKQIHDWIKENSELGKTIIIVGKYGKKSGKIHPEVAGSMGWSADPILIEDEEDIRKLEDLKDKKFYLVCQTTFNEFAARTLISKIIEIANQNGGEIEVNFSICDVQKHINMASCRLADSSDLMIVVGSKNSSNTTELYNNLCHITNTCFLEKSANWAQELMKFGIKITKNTKIGITSGASTDPEELKNLKREIEKYLLEEHMEINVNAHSSIQIGEVFIDPYLIEDDTKKAKYILLTHTHYDHMSLPDLQKVSDAKTIFVAPKDAAETLDKNYPKNKKYYLAPNEAVKFADLAIETLPAYNKTKQFHKREYNWLAYKLTIEGTTYLICGDSDATKELENQSVDVLFVPIGGTYTMDAREACELANKICPKIVVPVHYNTIVGNKDDEKVFLKNLDSSITPKIFL